MNKLSEIDEFVENIKKKCPEIIISQLTSFGEKPFKSGVWRFWHKDNKDIHISIEVHDGMLWAIYSNKEFENKYPIKATKICEFLNENLNHPDSKMEISQKAYQLWNENKAIEAGKLIYESLPEIKRPLWASNILSFCLKLTRSKPEFLTVINTANDPKQWKNAHEVFQLVRKLTLIDEQDRNQDEIFSGILNLAENTAKVTYNAGNFSAPFDHDSGWWIIQNLKYIVEKVNDKEFEKKVLKIAFEFNE